MERKKQLLPNGETLAYFDEGTASKNLVLIHGNLSSSVYFESLIEDLKKEYRIIAPDLRGYGDSSYVHRFDSLLELAEDVSSLLSMLNLSQYALLGWSLGGGVAMELAVLDVTKVTHLILMSATTHLGYPIFQKDHKFQAIFGKVYATKDQLALDPVQVKPVIEAIEQKNHTMMTAVYDYTIYTVKKPNPEQNKRFIHETLKERSLVDSDYALATLNMSNEISFYGLGNGRIHQIKAPVLHIWGKNDKTVPEYMLHANVNALKDQSTVIVYDDCGHSPIVDQFEPLKQAITTFIS